MPVRLPIERVKAKFDPYRRSPWRHSEIRPCEVRLAIAEKRYQSSPVPDLPGNRKKNIERIAYLVKQGWTDAIQIDIGCPEFAGWLSEQLEDGWHRLAAAIYRQDETILANVSGSLAYAQKLFGVDCDNRLTEQNAQ